MVAQQEVHYGGLRHTMLGSVASSWHSWTRMGGLARQWQLRQELVTDKRCTGIVDTGSTVGCRLQVAEDGHSQQMMASIGTTTYTGLKLLVYRLLRLVLCGSYSGYCPE